MISTLNRISRMASLIAIGSCALLAQGTQTGNIAGEVINQSGQPVAGATVRLTSPALQGVREIVTDERGKFLARLLPPGLYTIRVNKDGNESKVIQQLGVDQTFSPRITLSSKVAQATVEVVASEPAVDKTEIKSATNFRQEVLDQLPNARTMEGAALLTPGVTTGVGGRVQIRGAMTSSNLMLLDGQNIEDNTYNTRGVRIIDEAVEETQILTGAISAEYGNVDGGVMNAVTKSGSNTFTGQLRYDLSNPAWNSFGPMQPRTALSNKLNEQLTLSLGGFFIPDRLWFYFSYFSTDTSTDQVIGDSLPGPGGAGSPYSLLQKEYRRQGKLTWSINQNHTLQASYVKSANTQINRDYSAGELKALVPQANESSFYNLNLRSILRDNITMEIRLGQKKQKLSAGADPANGSPIYDYDTGYFYNNGIFNNKDGGDNRDNKTGNLKFSIFLEAMGSHVIDTGVDYYEGVRQARNEQTPTGFIFGVTGLSLTARTAYGSDIWTFESAAGEAKNTSIGVYINDKWTLNSNFTFQLGGRFDNYKAVKEDGSTNAKASGFSPRLGMSYDIMGDSKYVAKLSYCIYNGKLSEGILNKATKQGSPAETDYLWAGSSDAVPFSEIMKPSNYDYNAVGYFSDASLNVRINSSLKPPTVTELMASFAYSNSHATIGDYWARVTLVDKKWKKLVDDKVGNHGTVQDKLGRTFFVNYWDNSDIAERKYQALELDAELKKNSFTIGGNITWSKLEGNYEGEGTSTPNRGESLENFTVVNGVRMLDENFVAPYGYLTGHVPIRARVNAGYTLKSSLGSTSFGMIYRFDSINRFSNTRLISRARLNPALPSQFGTNGTQWLNGRGDGSFYSQAQFDLAITHDMDLFKVKDRAVRAFLKLDIRNVFNHQQQYSFNTSWNSATGTYPTAVNSPWVPGPSYGKATGNANYGLSRTILVAGGIRF